MLIRQIMIGYKTPKVGRQLSHLASNTATTVQTHRHLLLPNGHLNVIIYYTQIWTIAYNMNTSTPPAHLQPPVCHISSSTCPLSSLRKSLRKSPICWWKLVVFSFSSSIYANAMNMQCISTCMVYVLACQPDALASNCRKASRTF